MIPLPAQEEADQDERDAIELAHAMYSYFNQYMEGKQIRNGSVNAGLTGFFFTAIVESDPDVLKNEHLFKIILRKTVESMRESYQVVRRFHEQQGRPN